ncbi:MAG: phenylacetate-CoA oxygenase subunit PaaC [Acidimicrobiales bacterium]|jgi:ring-1,2-phenylacetyl-CoA epoxidase subunit PaaC|nr:phenylacetate-CoA oxygenase subunit PaaC [Acidimicrobiales bacterium]|tara:strand:+ start:1454 stop:2212 length:759 start_codon:yes stop_codon:yes gene_type:complete
MTGLGSSVREFLLAFADDEHLMGQQHTEWIGVAPFLEEDLAFSSIAQDELGHAAALYAIVAGDGDPVDNDLRIDELAFRPSPDDWRCAQLVEVASDDWAHALVRHWLYDSAEQLRWEQVAQSSLIPLAEAAARAEREERYHRRHADGLLDVLLPAADSAERLQAALADLLPLAIGIFDPVAGEAEVVATGVASAPFDTRLDEWKDRVRHRFDFDPDRIEPMAPTGRLVRHPDFGPLLVRMREVIDLDPAAVW